MVILRSKRSCRLVYFLLNCSSIITFKVYYKWISVLNKICCVLNNRLVRDTSFQCLIKDHKQNLCKEIVITFPNSLSIYVMERSHMTSAAEGGWGFKMLTVADKGGRGSKPCRRQQKYLNFSKNCFKSSVPITMRETTALICFPKLMTTFSLS